MARLSVKRCDICGKETEVILGKIQFIPSIPGVNKLAHSNYTHHADVGECCKDKLFKAFKFQRRISASEYQKKRKRNQAALGR